MTVHTVEKNLANRTMVVTAEFDASIDRVWQLWADPRQLERWWGPPVYPASSRPKAMATTGYPFFRPPPPVVAGGAPVAEIGRAHV